MPLMTQMLTRDTPVGTVAAEATAEPASEADLELAARLVGACPTPALLVEDGGRVRVANPPAIDLLRLNARVAGAGIPVREVLGVGWRELLVISRTGNADLVADLPPAADGRRRGTRVRVEPVSANGTPARAMVAFLETPARRTASGRSSAVSGASFDAIFGHDPALCAAKQAAVRFARTLLPVLLLAETGTGKELLARALHETSPRDDQPFVAINCGALSPHLLESELFGYAPGAFTGASREGYEGKIGAARGGTLFLDEVAEMPGPLQALLLRVLEDGTYYRVGENRPRQADVRLVCATCRDLPRLVAEGGFRQDLFYRINGACLSLPPVRQRTDVADLVLHLLGQLAERPDLFDGGPAHPPRLSPAAFEWLVSQPWPGNVRQLKAALQHALILCDSAEIGLEHLPARLEGLIAAPVASPRAETEEPRTESKTTPATATGQLSRVSQPSQTAGTTASTANTANTATARTLAEREADRLLLAVEAAGGNLTRAAGGLGIARSTLYRRLRKHGLIA